MKARNVSEFNPSQPAKGPNNIDDDGLDDGGIAIKLMVKI